MKHLLRILFVLALLCGGSSIAHANGIDFRMTVLDPPNGCLPGDDSSCAVYHPGAPALSVGLSVDSCTPFGLSSGSPSTPYGCLIINNLTGSTVTSLDLSFLADPLGDQPASCDSGGQDGLPSALDVVSCGQVGSLYSLNFAGGTGVPNGSDLIVFEEGADPTLFEGGTAIVGITPEPDSLLLFSTGVMMAGLYMSRRIWTTVKGSAVGNR
jgi:hypothetical protein